MVLSLIRNDGVVGSIPICGTKKKNKINLLIFIGDVVFKFIEPVENSQSLILSAFATFLKWSGKSPL